MSCSTRAVHDCVYGLLDDAGPVEAHLRACKPCAGLAAGYRREMAFWESCLAPKRQVARSRPSPLRLAWAFGPLLALISASGVIFMVSSTQDKPEEIKAELKATFDSLSAMSDEQRLAAVRAILANERYKKYARGLYNDVAEMEPALAQKVRLEAEARGAVLPFLARVAPSDSRDEVELLYDEAHALLDRYSTTTYAARLTAVRDELQKRMGELSVGGGWNDDFLTLQREARKLGEGSGDFDGALKQVDEFGVKWKGDKQLNAKLTAFREELARSAEKYVARLWSGRGKMPRDEARRMLAEARSRLTRFPHALEKLDGHIDELK